MSAIQAEREEQPTVERERAPLNEFNFNVLDENSESYKEAKQLAYWDGYFVNFADRWLDDESSKNNDIPTDFDEVHYSTFVFPPAFWDSLAQSVSRPKRKHQNQDVAQKLMAHETALTRFKECVAAHNRMRPGKEVSEESTSAARSLLLSEANSTKASGLQLSSGCAGPLVRDAYPTSSTSVQPTFATAQLALASSISRSSSTNNNVNGLQLLRAPGRCTTSEIPNPLLAAQGIVSSSHPKAPADAAKASSSPAQSVTAPAKRPRRSSRNKASAQTKTPATRTASSAINSLSASKAAAANDNPTKSMAPPASNAPSPRVSPASEGLSKSTPPSKSKTPSARKAPPASNASSASNAPSASSPPSASNCPSSLVASTHTSPPTSQASPIPKPTPKSQGAAAARQIAPRPTQVTIGPPLTLFERLFKESRAAPTYNLWQSPVTSTIVAQLADVRGHPRRLDAVAAPPSLHDRLFGSSHPPKHRGDGTSDHSAGDHAPLASSSNQ